MDENDGITANRSKSRETRSVCIETGVNVGYDPFYSYFVEKNFVYRIRKKFLVHRAGIMDRSIRIRVRHYNAKLREKIGEIPADIYSREHMYCVRGDGMVLDAGERHGIPSKHECLLGYKRLDPSEPDDDI